MDPLFNTPYDPFQTITGDNNSVATRPGQIPLSQERLHRFHPGLWELKPWMFWLRKHYKEFQLFRIHVGEHLRYGLAEAAIVVQLDPLIVACYAEELDAVIHLIFLDSMPDHPTAGTWYPEGLRTELVTRHSLRVGSRLLAVNTFQHIAEEGYAPDIIPGPRARGVYGNFAPYIADFLALDLQRVETIKRTVEEYEWQRCQELSDDFETHVVDADYYPRDGRPMMCLHGEDQEWLPGHEPAHIKARQNS